MSSFVAILPGARVRTDEGIVGTVERLENHAEERSAQPDHMIVRSEDGRWRYSIPLMLVRTVSQETFHTMAYLAIGTGELPRYIVAELDPVHEDATLPAVPSGEWAPSGPQETLRLPLAAEELTAHKQAVLLGTVHLHKGVESVEQRISVPVYHEETVIEHIAPDQYDGRAPANPNETIIPVIEEQLVVEKRAVVKEYIRVRKTIVTEQRAVQETVRREYVEMSEERLDGAGGTGSPLVRLAGAGTTREEVAAPSVAQAT